MTVPTLETLVRSVPTSLGSHGPVLAEIRAALRSPHTSLVSVSGAIVKDPDLTARLLRLGNSAFYGFATRLATVAEVVSLIGLQQVEALLVASSVIERFRGVALEFVTMESFWRHSLACGIAARALALARRTPKADRFFVEGLLHDVGRLVLYAQAPDLAQDVFKVYRGERILLREAESRVLGYDHAQLGAALLRHWQNPQMLVEAVAHHHAPEASGAAPIEAAIVHVADHVVNAMSVGSSGEHWVPPLRAAAWQSLHCPVEVLATVVEAVDEQLEPAEAVFLAPRSPGLGHE